MTLFKNIPFLLISRLVLAAILIVFGSNKFLHFMPLFQANIRAETFFNGMINSGYLFPALGILEMLVGILLITRKAVPFALIVLAPISVNIILFHIFLFPQGISPGLIVFLLNIYLVKKYWHRYERLFD
jgi:uncharacterized membrane protein YphA (DoxX/SURF4 family)